MLVLLASFALAGVPELLAARDGVRCADLGPPDAPLLASLMAATEPEGRLPMVPMRAATCLAVLFPDQPEVADLFASWMPDPARLGQAMLVADHVDRLPLDVGLRLVRAARATQDPDARARLQVRFARSTHPEIVALAR